MTELRFKSFIEGAIKRVDFIQGLDNELAKMSAMNHLKGYLEGGLEVYEIVHHES